MRTLVFSAIIFLLLVPANSQTPFQDNFSLQTLRINWVIGGNASSQQAFLKNLSMQPHYGGALYQFARQKVLGDFKVVLTDVVTSDTIYESGFCNLFQEWQTTDEAKKVYKSFDQVTTVPLPLRNTVVTICRRQKNQVFESLLRFEFEPLSVDIAREPLPEIDWRCLLNNGPSDKCVDFVFIAEGYTHLQHDKFYKDVERLFTFLLKQEPYSKYANRINIWAVALNSLQSGTDDPNKRIWKNTALNAGFNTFGTDRYLETFDLHAIHNAAALVPNDHIIVLVNTNKYGGGGVYNHFSISSADNPLSGRVLLHELGHGFGGLGDEYYDSEVAYSDYYNLTTEPWEPNLTTLVNFDLKWKSLIDANTPVPTPDVARFNNSIGVFEGGGYAAKGIYRPAIDCVMKSNRASAFCAVCQLQIEKVIQSLTE